MFEYFIQHKVLSVLLIPYRLFVIKYFKFYDTQVHFHASSSILIGNSFIEIKWETSNAYLVKITGKGIVNTKGSLLIPNTKINRSLTITVIGQKKLFKKLSFSKIDFNWQKPISSTMNEKSPELIYRKNAIAMKPPVVAIKKPILQQMIPTINIPQTLTD